jgi:hypothetical protein
MPEESLYDREEQEIHWIKENKQLVLHNELKVPDVDRGMVSSHVKILLLFSVSFNPVLT